MIDLHYKITVYVNCCLDEGVFLWRRKGNIFLFGAEDPALALRREERAVFFKAWCKLAWFQTCESQTISKRFSSLSRRCLAFLSWMAFSSTMLFRDHNLTKLCQIQTAQDILNIDNSLTDTEKTVYRLCWLTNIWLWMTHEQWRNKKYNFIKNWFGHHLKTIIKQTYSI